MSWTMATGHTRTKTRLEASEEHRDGEYAVPMADTRGEGFRTVVARGNTRSGWAKVREFAEDRRRDKLHTTGDPVAHRVA